MYGKSITIALNRTFTERDIVDKFYPNPNDGVFFIHLNHIPKFGHFETYDVLGRKVVQSSLQSAREVINISEKGVCTLLIYESNQMVKLLKLIVQ